MAPPIDPWTFLFYVGLYLALALALVYILLCGDHPVHEGGAVGKLNSFFLSSFPSFLKKRLLPRVFGSTARAQRVTDFCGTLFERYVMPLGYHLLLMCCLFVAQTSLIPRLPELEFRVPGAACPASRFLCLGSGTSFPPAVPAGIIPFYYALGLASWLLVYLTDAGTLSARGHAVHVGLYPYDHLLFHASAEPCRTCHRSKPARSKHCRLCNVCVSRFDHHCGWMATCIGLYNHRFFVLFLFVHAMLLAHGAVVAAEVARASVQRLVRGAFIFTPTGQRITHATLRVLLTVEPVACMLAMAFALSALFVLAFAIYNVVQVAHNVTTNESAKWDAVHVVAKQYRSTNGRSIWQAMREEAAVAPPPSRLATRSGGGGGNRDELPAFNADGNPVHLYDRGYWANFSEVLFPGRFVRQRMACMEAQMVDGGRRACGDGVSEGGKAD